MLPDVNECMLTPPVCQNGGSCYNSYGSFVCRCPPEWTGPTCIEGRYTIASRQLSDADVCTVELQWLEHLWDHENMFETGVVRANEC